MGSAASSKEESFQAHYTLGKQLGKGAQGRVHVCLHKATGANFAVKLIERSAKTSWSTYRREVELSQAGRCRHVVNVLADFHDNDYCYIVMERFEGHLRKGLKWLAREESNENSTAALGEEALRGLVRQVLSGIAHLHRVGIVHRDVKSHNVFIDRLDVRDSNLRAVLGDLGLARRLEPGRFLCAQVGTRKYWAPELYEKKYAHVVDVFALGVLIFLTASAQYPFMDERQTRMKEVVSEALSPPGEEFLQLCLQKNPAKRPCALELLMDGWLARESTAPTPKVCGHWQSRQVPRVAGDVAAAEDDGESSLLENTPKKGPDTPTTGYDPSPLEAKSSPATGEDTCDSWPCSPEKEHIQETVLQEELWRCRSGSSSRSPSPGAVESL